MAKPASDLEFSPRRLARSVLANWLGHLVFVAGGFLVPRFIYDALGEARLGVWDFGWSTVSYMSMLTVGITSSTNRYVARYRATEDWVALNRITGACLLIFLGTALLAVVGTVVATAFLPQLLGGALADHLSEARWILLLLGISSAVQMPLSVCGGVITGCERYDLANWIRSGGHAVLVVGVLIVLQKGYGLTALAALVLMSELVIGGVSYIVARRLCPAFVFSPGGARWAAIKEVTVFGWKVFLERGSRILLYATCSMLVVYALGPMHLALYARSSALVQNAYKMMYQFGRVFTPLASRMQARGDIAGATRLLVSSTRQSLLIALPMVAVLSILGGPLLTIWMGPKFGSPTVLAVLAIGHLGTMAQVGPYFILLGLNRHGMIGVATFVCSVVGVGLSALFLGVFAWGILGVAVGISLSLGTLNCIVIPVLTTRVVGMTVRRYFVRTVPGPLAAVVPFGAVLAVVQYGCNMPALPTLFVGLGIGLPILGLTYWYSVLSLHYRARLGDAVVKQVETAVRFLLPNGRR